MIAFTQFFTDLRTIARSVVSKHRLLCGDISCTVGFFYVEGALNVIERRTAIRLYEQGLDRSY